MPTSHKVLTGAATQTPKTRVNPAAMSNQTSQTPGGGGPPHGTSSGGATSQPGTSGDGASGGAHGGGASSSGATGGGASSSGTQGGGTTGGGTSGGGQSTSQRSHHIQQINVVATTNAGRFEPFDPKQLSWDCYYERLDQFFIANDVVDDNKKRALLITSLSMEQYRLLTNFFAPVSPTTVPFAQLCRRLKQHFVPEKVEIAEVFKFYHRKQLPDEDVKTFLADLRHRAKDCNLGTFLERALRDTFVIGLRDQRVQAKLFTVRNLTLDGAIDTAQSMESASQQTQKMRRPEASFSSGSVNFRSREKKSVQVRSCYRCGNQSHLANKCPHLHKVCSTCKKEGHLSSVCRSTRSDNKPPVD